MYDLVQRFPTYGTRTTNGTQRGLRWYAKYFSFLRNANKLNFMMLLMEQKEKKLNFIVF